MDYPKSYIKKGVNTVFFRPRDLLSYLPDDLKLSICASLDVDSLEDKSLFFDYDVIQDCFSVSTSFEFGVNVKNEFEK